MSENVMSGWGERWPSPAKLNLLLRVVGRRSDGYHLLQTVFQFIDFCDYISFFPRSDRTIRLTSPLPGIAETDDLTFRAAKLLHQRGGVATGVDIEVEKRLPFGGGIGGGSSNAATVLLMLNRLWALGYSFQELMEFGLTLGADVPIFIHGRSAWAEGVGELLRPVEPKECWYVVLVPDCQVSTAEIFRADDLTRNNEPITIERFSSGFICNDCLDVVVARYPAVKTALDTLARFGNARLTGTGACVFLACDRADRAREIAAELESRYTVFVAKGCNRSPLHSKMNRFFNETH